MAYHEKYSCACTINCWLFNVHYSHVFAWSLESSNIRQIWWYDCVLCVRQGSLCMVNLLVALKLKNYLIIWSENGIQVFFFLCHWYVMKILKNIVYVLVSLWTYRLILSDFLLGGFGAIHQVIPWGPCHFTNSFTLLKVCLMFQFDNLKFNVSIRQFEGTKWKRKVWVFVI